MAWQIAPNTNVGPKVIDVTINNSDVGSSQFQFCLYLEGNLDHISYWYFDDICLINPYPVDGFLFSIAPTPSLIATPVPVQGTITNTGSTTITSAVIDWQLNNGMIHSSSFTGLSIPWLSFYNFTCTDLMVPPIGMNNLKVWIRDINGSPDSDPSNDTISTNVQMVCYPVARKPLYEEFSSSTCPYCPMFDDQFMPWCDSHDKEITLVKYEMNWPEPGDPYYTAEGGVRNDYYYANAVPLTECDGVNVVGNTNLNCVQEAFDREIQQAGMMKIVSSHILTGHVINVTATILPFASFPNLRLYVAVVEKHTYNNASTSGETVFEHVMMKMMPDAHGTTVNLIDRQPYTYTGSVDLTGTHVERWDDLMVTAWVQDSLELTRQVYQSDTSMENGVFAAEDRLINILVDGTGIPEFNPNTFNYFVTIPGSISTAPDVKGIPFDTNETVIVIPPRFLPGTTTIDVFAENNLAHNLYTVEFSFPVGITGTEVSTVSVYPNPAIDKVYISGADHSAISLYSSTGICLQKSVDFTGTAISLSGFPKGLYMLKIERRDGGITEKKIVVR
jgi:hypothetical protein